MIPWLNQGDPFPPVHRALREPNGLLAAGGDLSPERLLQAYRAGIFPWYNAGEPILWWSPDPRMVLFPEEFKPSRSLRKTLRRRIYEPRLDTSFARVMQACAEPRPGQQGTWITAEMRRAYLALHELGHAHSVESWQGDQMVGGLYGVAIGRVFYGESMFARAPDASKVALAYLCRYLECSSFAVIDCQMVTSHLASLGARPIPRSRFTAGLTEWTREGPAPGKWPVHGATDLI